MRLQESLIRQSLKRKSDFFEHFLSYEIAFS